MSGSKSAPATALVGGASIACAAAFALSRGISVARLEQATGVSIQALLTSTTGLPLALRNALWEELARHGRGRLIAFDMADACGFSALGGLAEMVRVAPDLRSALRCLIENSDLLGDDITLGLQETARACAFKLSQRRHGIGDDLAGEAAITLKLRLFRDAIGPPFRVREIHLAWAAHGPLALYEQEFGILPRFECDDGVSIVFDRALLDRSPSTTNLEQFQALQLQFALQRRLRWQALEETEPDLRLQQAIAQRAALGDYSVQGVAREAGMSVRSAQRMAATRDTTLRQLIDRSRAAIAKNLMMHNPQRPIGEVALRVGYSDERAFRRAFKRWTHMTPSAFRRVFAGSTSP